MAEHPGVPLRDEGRPGREHKIYEKLRQNLERADTGSAVREGPRRWDGLRESADEGIPILLRP